MNRMQEPDSFGITMLGLAGAILVLALVLGLQALYLRMEAAELERKGRGPMPAQATQLGQQAQLEVWKRLERGRYQIPVERAMELVVRELEGRPDAPAVDGGVRLPGLPPPAKLEKPGGSAPAQGGIHGP